MTREQKLALIVGFALVLVVGVLVSDHLSLAQERVSGDSADLASSLEPEAVAPGLGRDVGGLAIAESRPIDESYYTGESAIPTMEAPSGKSLQAQAHAALDRFGDLLKEAQNGNSAAAQTDVFETPASTRVPERDSGVDEATPREPAPERRRSGAGGETYPRHTVAKGESLWKIAERYYGDGTLHGRLASFNEERIGEGGTVRVGATLLVPPRAILMGGAEGDRVEMPSRGSDAGAEHERTYTVASGDTLSEISQRLLGTSKRWREILDMNDELDDAESLRVGMTLRVPSR